MTKSELISTLAILSAFLTAKSPGSIKEVITMTKLELIDAIAKKRNMHPHEVERVINAAISIITTELAQGNKVQLIGFGTFEVHDRAERSGRNPRTGEAITLPASKRVHFSPGKPLKEAVNGGNAHDR